MNKSMLAGTVAGALAVVAIGAYATTRLDIHPFGSYATVLAAEPDFRTERVPRQVCHDEQVTHQKPVADEKRIAGTAIGAILGGVLGNQVGGGSGKTLATAAGAVAGGYAGNKIQGAVQRGDTETTTEQRCETVYDTSRTPAGYTVTYEYDGKKGVVHMDHDPGKRLPVKDGKPDISAS